MTPAIAALGDINIDVLLKVATEPGRGEESFADTSSFSLGGSAVTTAVVLSRLDFGVTLLGQAGDDEFGRRAIAELEEAGVETDLVAISHADPTGMNIIMVTPDGERTMIGVRGANRAYRGDSRWAGRCGWLHLSAYALLEEPQRSAAREALDLATTEGIPVSIDLPSGVARNLGTEAFPDVSRATVLSGGGAALAAITPGPDPIESLLGSGVAVLAVTAGVGAFRLFTGAEEIELTPPTIDPVDTTGAGDSFVAGLVASYLWELEAGPMAVVAATLGAVASLRQGGGNESWRPDLVGRVLEADRWADADPDWLEAAHRLAL